MPKSKNQQLRGLASHTHHSRTPVFRPFLFFTTDIPVEATQERIKIIIFIKYFNYFIIFVKYFVCVLRPDQNGVQNEAQ